MIPYPDANCPLIYGINVDEDEDKVWRIRMECIFEHIWIICMNIIIRLKIKIKI